MYMYTAHLCIVYLCIYVVNCTYQRRPTPLGGSELRSRRCCRMQRRFVPDRAVPLLADSALTTLSQSPGKAAMPAGMALSVERDVSQRHLSGAPTNSRSYQGHHEATVLNPYRCLL